MTAEFSNKDRNVFLIKLDRMIDRGALLSRYSRTSSFDIRDIYSKEFVGDTKRGADFYRKIFIEYGDESISELVTAQIGVQGISNVCAQQMEDSRIGLSFLEKSSRYVRYDKKLDGRYPYLSGEECGYSGSIAIEYDELCNELFDFYTITVNRLVEILKGKIPLGMVIGDAKEFSAGADEKVVERAYKRAITARALDDARFILPASTKTNLGISGNARAYVNMILRMKSSWIPEINHTAIKIEGELEPEFPELIEAARDKHADDSINFRKSRYDTIYEKLNFEREDPATLLSYSKEREFETMFEELNKDGAGPEKGSITIENLVDSIVKLRKNRRDKPGRLLEIPDMSFLINMSFGTFRDFHRHRMFTIIRGPLKSTSRKFIPEMMVENKDLLVQYNNLMAKSHSIWKTVMDKYGIEKAQYAIPFSQIYGFLVKGNLQEFTYFIELRTTPAAHYEIRDISNAIYNKITGIYPKLSKIVKFADQNRYGAGRIFEEIKKEIKRQKIQGSKF